jgi:hypothetical protein
MSGGIRVADLQGETMRTNILITLAGLGALCLSAPPPEASEPIRGSVGGFMNIGLVYQVNQNDELGVLRDGEIHLNFKGVSDSGLTFRGRVELEGFTTGDQIDENWAEVSGSFGAVRFGSDDDASDWYLAGYFETPSTIVGYFDSDASPFETSTGADNPSVFYTTPELSGFKATVSWAPAIGADGLADSGLTFGDDHKLAIGGGYEGEFSGISVAVGGGFLYVEDVTSAWQAGGTVGYQGFSFGVHVDEDGFEDPVSGGLFSTLSVGVQYETGPWTFAGGWSTSLDGPSVNNWGIWATYQIMKGVTATLGYEGNDDDSITGFDTTVAGWVRIGF